MSQQWSPMKETARVDASTTLLQGSQPVERGQNKINNFQILYKY